MKRLIFLLLLAAVAWYGWQHRAELFERKSGHEAVIENLSGREMTRVRLSVGGQTFVKESIPDGGKVAFTFRVASDASFELTWQFAGAPSEMAWSGGMVPRGPMLQRHVMSVDPDGAVLYRPENK